ncbi:hypothetical protein M231_06392 [Tremella mesenterica]|uniref:Uncharacterized protein n=1 Tax=Tremella mesenterica TaxID=5217 RepID=A0A4Q1BF85_TREME|nr:hypothetical protein M231_06392 [Tremella mesenterica]
MLPRRLPLSNTVIFTSKRSSSTITAVRDFNHDSEPDQYPPGPSRIPYQPPSSSQHYFNKANPSSTVHPSSLTHNVKSSLHSHSTISTTTYESLLKSHHVQSTTKDRPQLGHSHLLTTNKPIKTRHSAKLLRQQLQLLSRGHFSSIDHLFSTILKDRQLNSFSRLGLHVLLHCLLSQTKGSRLAIQAITLYLQTYYSSSPSSPSSPPISTSLLSTISSSEIRNEFSSSVRHDLSSTLHHHLTNQIPRYHSSGNIISPRTLNHIMKHLKPVNLTAPPPPSSSPQLNPTKHLTRLFDLLVVMEQTRQCRPAELYEAVIRQCCVENRPDLAAKLYVEWVEDWVTQLGSSTTSSSYPETNLSTISPASSSLNTSSLNSMSTSPGRSDLNANEEKNQIGEKERRKPPDHVKSWWKPLRTWRLPGEVVSPLGRLDLWHPQNLSIGSKMRSFPYPLFTPPSSPIPEPHEKFISIILSSLKTDPDENSHHHFISSSRALAILGTTILSRTTPVPSLGRLVKKLNQVPSYPPVYPDNVDINNIDESDRWAYEAYTQAHLALQSLIFSPPMSGASLRHLSEMRKQLNSPSESETVFLEDTTGQMMEKERRYDLGALGFSECVFLVEYALRRLRAPKILGKLMEYVGKAFKPVESPQLHNAILRGGTILRDPSIYRNVQQGLFSRSFEPDFVSKRSQIVASGNKNSSETSNKAIEPFVPRVEETSVDSLTPVSPDARTTPLSQSRVSSSSDLPNTSNSSSSPSNAVSPATKIPEPDVTFELGPSEPNQHSLIALFSHLSSTSQFSRIETLIYRLLPFLDTRNYPPNLAPSLRPKVEHLSPGLYVSILSALQKCHKPGLAQRVFSLALRADEEWAIQRPTPPIRNKQDRRSTYMYGQELPIHAFTSMLLIWADEGKGRIKHLTRPLGWYVEGMEGKEKMSRAEAAPELALWTYGQARKRWEEGGGVKPDERFFNAMIDSCAGRWGLRGRSRYYSPDPSVGPCRESTDRPLSQMSHVGVQNIIDDGMRYSSHIGSSRDRDRGGDRGERWLRERATGEEIMWARKTNLWGRESDERRIDLESRIRFKEEMECVIFDMQEWGIEVPIGLLKHMELWGVETPSESLVHTGLQRREEIWKSWKIPVKMTKSLQATREFSADLALMQVGWMEQLKRMDILDA